MDILFEGTFLIKKDKFDKIAAIYISKKFRVCNCTIYVPSMWNFLINNLRDLFINFDQTPVNLIVD